MMTLETIPLKTVKIVGFKSFVKPTVIHFKGPLTAFVGPNGCGKSNVADAVRWATGEGSPKHLRAESVTDVIFNGTSNRQPLSQASVELVFDNTNGGLGGKYASYTEISIRRVINREAQSIYYINGGRCRRRDVVDIFLGTGLGPRSYAIIGQGTINRFIEAKPEERSHLLREAAGISRYPERRRDTENRIKQTRENMKRVKDLLEEIDKQRQHLDKQAASATRFKRLKKKERELKAQSLAITYRDLTTQLAEENKQLGQEEVELESKLAQQRQLEKEIEAARLQHTEDTDHFNEIQTRYYRLTADIGALEQRIQHNQERDKQLLDDMAQIDHSLKEINKNIEEDTEKTNAIDAIIKQLEPDLKLAINVANESQARLQHEEKNVQSWQLARDEFINEAAKSDQQVEVEQTRIKHLEQQLTVIQQRQQRLEKSLSEINIENWPKKIQRLQTETEQYQQASEKAKIATEALDDKIIEQRQLLEDHNSRLSDQRETLQDLRARQTSFELLQKTALSQNNKALSNWLDTQGFSKHPLLAKRITVANGWERAVETVLGEFMQAICLPEFAKTLPKQLSTLEGGGLGLYLAHPLEDDELLRTRFGERATSLLEKINSEVDLTMLLKYVYAAKSLEDALALRGSLEAHESIVTKDGSWVGPTWIRFKSGKADTKNIFECERELATLSEQIPEVQKRFEQEEAAIDAIQANLATLENEKKEAQQIQSQLITEYNDKRTEFTTSKSQFDHLTQRKTTLELEVEENELQLRDTQDLLSSAQKTLSTAREQSQTNEEKRKALMSERNKQQESLDYIRQQARADKEMVDDLSLRLESNRNQQHFLSQSINRAKSQLASLKERYKSLEESKQTSASPVEALESELETALQSRVKLEAKLNEARATVEAITKKSQSLDTAYRSTLDAIQKIRASLEAIRLKQNGLQMRLASHEEQVSEWGFEMDTLLGTLAESANAEESERQLQRLIDQIERLGPINLAAIADSEQLAERQNYLNEQHDDLEKALEMLEQAIEKIDNETRVRFKEAYEKINTFFQTLFPQIFLGGKGHLELNDSDLLTAGVDIKVQPPGKRPATIHSLSGGEKALTAIALVFAFFQLNPAPFCILDEVDAPLDDVNVNRFCDLLKEMSKTIQFIFITHNKIVMETAKQLMGVTMRELGVSRLVSVDIESAMELVEQKQTA